LIICVVILTESRLSASYDNLSEITHVHVWFQLNLGFLCNILRALIFQLHSHPQEPSNFRFARECYSLLPRAPGRCACFLSTCLWATHQEAPFCGETARCSALVGNVSVLNVASKVNHRHATCNSW